ncbi:MAG: hypothetical protein KC417_13645 [Myxococcales bacterium]|nr:hypothetical protein [Myxococcales bacterium]
MRHRKPSSLAFFLLLPLLGALTIGASDAHAQNAITGDVFAEVDDLGGERVLGGHAFIPSLVNEFALVTTSFGALTAFGMQTVSLGTDNVGNDLGTVDLAAFDEQFQVGIRITEAFGIRADLAGSVGVGADDKSALIAGANFAGGFGLGPVVRIFGTDDFMLSATLRGGFLTGAIISPLAFGNAILETGRINRGTLLTNVSQWSVAPALALAYAPMEAVGLQASARLNVEATDAEGQDTDVSTSVDLGATLTIDAVDLFAPVALLVSYAAAVPFGDDELQHGIEVGLFYSGLQHLNLGAAVASTIGAEESIFYAQLRLAHYW